MNKLIIIVMLFTVLGCSSIAYYDSTKYMYGYLFGFDSDIVTNEYFQNQPFSFANVKFGRGPSSTIVLAYIDTNDIYEWRSSDGVSIFTKDGFIIKTTGLGQDINFYYDFNDLKSNSSSYRAFWSFYSPDLINQTTILIHNTEKRKINYLGRELEVDTVIQKYKIDSIKFSGKNFFYFKDGRVISSVQKIHPKLPPIKIDYYYK